VGLGALSDPDRQTAAEYEKARREPGFSVLQFRRQGLRNAYSSQRLKIREPFVPPKPKEFDRA
jgi:hypothetical protein